MTTINWTDSNEEGAKKMKVRVLSLLLALAMLCTLLPQVALPVHAETYSGFCGAEGDGSNLIWTLDTDTGLLTIEGSGAMEHYYWEGAPWYRYNSAITAIDLPEGLTNIGSYSFQFCDASTSVTIPGSVTSIGVRAFGYYYDKGYQKIDGFTISGYAGSAAENYATENGFEFVSLGMLSKPTITTQPQDYTGPAGTSAKFTVKAAGENLTYQWYSKTPNGSWTKSNFAGNKTATLTVSVTAARNGYQYRCVVSNEAGSVTSNAATLHVVTPPTITTQPQDCTGPAGTQAKFTVKATGDNLTYQWYSKTPNGSWTKSNFAGNKTATLTVSLTAARNGYQ